MKKILEARCEKEVFMLFETNFGLVWYSKQRQRPLIDQSMFETVGDAIRWLQNSFTGSEII